MSISLTPEQIQRIQQQLHTGHYASAAEVIDRALKLLEASTEEPRRGEKMLKMFEETGFLGSLPDANPDLSSNYKSIIYTEIGSQHDSC
ncbi:type II toxin-antitoxin system ParD family antitoxin [Nostoc sp. 2RC]|uniref:ribbon-helix-helix domain-containing protein n=1 Tax=Nostoc sp. 2RC TaxID=2485484 RepID=UPI001624799E|nr:type II toxin-antitoxin system ParD family antitoxin [Nostoc sp. 2RC]MBC1238625.1 type II toxin-antitoxin system ParD family antitoxin [Nostoc sp. 2RC]